MLVAGIAILVAAAKFQNYGDDGGLPAVIVEVEDGPPRPVETSYTAYSRYPVGGQRDERTGGFGPSGNFPKRISATDAFGKPKSLSVVVAADQTARIGQFSGLHVRIVNHVLPKDHYFSSSRFAALPCSGGLE